MAFEQLMTEAMQKKGKEEKKKKKDKKEDEPETAQISLVVCRSL